MPVPKPIKISVENGKINCSDGGHVRTHRLARIEWGCNEDFTLTFAKLDGKNTPAWPFREPPQPPVPKGKSFKGTLKDVGPEEEAPAYKYTIIVGTHKLDPIIIVDK
jgi:hypothetical protein